MNSRYSRGEAKLAAIDTLGTDYALRRRFENQANYGNKWDIVSATRLA